jgi:hypothetical protein
MAHARLHATVVPYAGASDAVQPHPAAPATGVLPRERTEIANDRGRTVAAGVIRGGSCRVPSHSVRRVWSEDRDALRRRCRVSAVRASAVYDYVNGHDPRSVREAHGEARANQRKPKAKRQCHACRRAGSTPGLSRPCSNLHGSARGQTARGKPRDLALPRGT